MKPCLGHSDTKTDACGVAPSFFSPDLLCARTAAILKLNSVVIPRFRALQFRDDDGGARPVFQTDGQCIGAYGTPCDDLGAVQGSFSVSLMPEYSDLQN